MVATKVGDELEHSPTFINAAVKGLSLRASGDERPSHAGGRPYSS
jgi:hypothetical protein